MGGGLSGPESGVAAVPASGSVLRRVLRLAEAEAFAEDFASPAAVGAG